MVQVRSAMYISAYTLVGQASCTLQSCIDTYTKVDVLTDFRCRKCTLITTLEALTQELQAAEASGTASVEALEDLKGKIRILKDAIQYNVEASLVSSQLACYVFLVS